MAQILIEGPKASAEPAPSERPIIDLEAVLSAAAEPSEPAAPEQASRWRLPAYAPLAAAIALVVTAVAIAGAAATSNYLREPAPSLAVADASRALQESVTQLSNDLTALKTGVASAQRAATAQYAKFAERLDRTEKAQAESTGKVARLQDSLDRPERRPHVATGPTPPADVTGSVAPKEVSKPQVAEGWRLRDYYDGRAVVESRNGTLFKVVPGSVVPGLGKVEAIKRENGRVVVVTASGIIAASRESRHPVFYMPRW